MRRCRDPPQSQTHQIVSTGSNDPKEYLGQFLIEHGKITEEQLDQAFQDQKRTKILLGKILVINNPSCAKTRAKPNQGASVGGHWPCSRQTRTGVRTASSLRPCSSLPQQMIVPLLRKPQVCSSPAATWVNTVLASDSGTVDSPLLSLPQ